MVKELHELKSSDSSTETNSHGKRAAASTLCRFAKDADHPARFPIATVLFGTSEYKEEGRIALRTIAQNSTHQSYFSAIETLFYEGNDEDTSADYRLLNAKLMFGIFKLYPAPLCITIIYNQ